MATDGRACRSVPLASTGSNTQPCSRASRGTSHMMASTERTHRARNHSTAASGAAPVIVAAGSPWVDAKALAIASPPVVPIRAAGTPSAPPVTEIEAEIERVDRLSGGVVVLGRLVFADTVAFMRDHLAPSV